MRKLLLIFVTCQLAGPHVTSKPTTKPCAFADNQQTQAKPKNSGPIIPSYRRRMEERWDQWQKRVDFKWYARQTPRGVEKYARVNATDQTTATTTTKVILDDDCDYINYYCMRGYYTGHVCGKTIYNTYETFTSYCELEYMNCLEQYDMWTIAHMGTCYNVSSFKDFGYYAYALWDNEQLEEMYVMPNS